MQETNNFLFSHTIKDPIRSKQKNKRGLPTFLFMVGVLRPQSSTKRGGACKAHWMVDEK